MNRDLELRRAIPWRASISISSRRCSDTPDSTVSLLSLVLSCTIGLCINLSVYYDSCYRNHCTYDMISYYYIMSVFIVPPLSVLADRFVYHVSHLRGGEGIHGSFPIGFISSTRSCNRLSSCNTRTNSKSSN